MYVHMYTVHYTQQTLHFNIKKYDLVYVHCTLYTVHRTQYIIIKKYSTKSNFLSLYSDAVVGDYTNRMNTTSISILILIYIKLLNSIDSNTHKHRSQEKLSIKKASL